MCDISPTQTAGTYPLEALPEGWENVRVKKPGSHLDLNRIEILDVHTRLSYRQEPLKLIARKYAWLVVYTPLYLFGYAVYQLIRIVVIPIVNLAPLAFFREAWKLMQLPSLFVAMEMGALYGVFCPLEGRAFYSKMESLLHDGKGKREAKEHEKKTPRTHLLDAFCVEEPTTACFAAPCMQPYGYLDDARILERNLRPNPRPV